MRLSISTYVERENNMKFPKNIKKEFKEVVNGKEKTILTLSIRPYLLNSDIEIIEAQIRNVATKQERRNIIDTLIMRFCTDAKDFDTDELDITILDMYRANNIIDTVKDSLDYESYNTMCNLLNPDAGEELRKIRVTFENLMEAVNNVQNGTAEEALKSSLNALEEAKEKLKV